MKKTLQTIFLFSIIISFSCLSIRETGSTVSREYCINNYRTDSFIVSLLDERKYNEMFVMLKNHIANNDKLSEDEKRKSITNIQNIDYANNKTFYFQFITNVALSEKDLNLSCVIYDENGNQIIEKIENFILKTSYYTYNRPLTELEFTYYWIMITNKKFLKNSNWTLIVKFPNNAIKKYSLKSL
jgi:hypothetical protein